MTSNTSHALRPHCNADCITLQLPRWLLHDLMQPLNAYGLASEQLKDSLQPSLSGNSDLQSSWRLMDNAVHTQEKMLQALRQFWHLHTDKAPFSLRAVSLASIANLLRTHHRLNFPRMDMQLNGFSDLNAWTHPDRFFDILAILCDNAATHAHSRFKVNAYACPEGALLHKCRSQLR